MTVTPSITLVPLGGLANRMRAIVSGYTLALDTGMPLHVVWLRNHDLNCSFNTLFRPFGHDIALTECSKADARVKYNVPRKKNFFLSAFYQKCHFAPRLYDTELCRLKDDGEALQHRVSGHNCLIESGLSFYKTDKEWFRTLFVPTDEIAALIAQRSMAFADRTVGLHIRRTDNRVSIAESPLALFTQKIDDELSLYPDTLFYLATDSEVVKAELRSRYGARIFTSPARADRDSTSGMKEAVVELYTLARTQHFYGSYYSSFSDLAALLANRPADILRVKLIHTCFFTSSFQIKGARPD